MRGVRVWALGCCALLACSGGREPELTQEPGTTAAPSDTRSQTETETETESEAVATLASLADADTIRRRYVHQLPVEEVRLPALAGETVRVLHPDRTVRARLETLVLADSSAMVEAVRAAAGPGSSDWMTHCTAPLATRVLVTLRCMTSWVPAGRGAYGEARIDVRHFAIEGGEVHRVELAEAFVPGTDLEALYARGFEAAPREAGPDDEEERWREPEWRLDAPSLGVRGVLLTWQDVYDPENELRTELPYASLLDVLRADGVVARMLRVATGETSAPAVGAEGPGPWTAGSLAPIAELAGRWSALPARLRGAVALALDRGGQGRLLIRPEVGIEAAREVASALGGTLAPLPESAAHVVTPVVMRATASLNVRAAPAAGATWIGTLPRGAAVVALREVAPSPRWVQVAAGPGMVGHASLLHLDEDDCLPEIEPPARLLPEDVRSTPALLRVHAEVTHEGRIVPAVVLLAATETSSWISLRRLARASCRAGSELASWRVPGRVIDLAVTRTAQRGGETLILAAQELRTSEAARWVALRIGAEAPVWSQVETSHPAHEGSRLRAPARRGPSGPGFWPLAIERRGAPIAPWRWDGSTLVEDRP